MPINIGLNSFYIQWYDSLQSFDIGVEDILTIIAQ